MGVLLYPSPLYNTLTINCHYLIIMKCFSILIAAICLSVISGQGKCKVDSEVRFILNNMTPEAVKREVDCVVGAGPCYNLGNRLKGEAPADVTQGRCRGNCNCEQKQVRLVVNKMKRERTAQWQRVESRYGRK